MVLVFKFLFLNSWVTLLIKQNLERYGNVRNISPCQQRRRQSGDGRRPPHALWAAARRGQGQTRAAALQLALQSDEGGSSGRRLRARPWRGSAVRSRHSDQNGLAWAGGWRGEYRGRPAGLGQPCRASCSRCGLRPEGDTATPRLPRGATGQEGSSRARADGQGTGRGAKGWGAGSGPAGSFEKTTLDARGRSDRKFSFM